MSTVKLEVKDYRNATIPGLSDNYTGKVSHIEIDESVLGVNFKIKTMLHKDSIINLKGNEFWLIDYGIVNISTNKDINIPKFMDAMHMKIIEIFKDKNFQANKKHVKFSPDVYSYTQVVFKP